MARITMIEPEQATGQLKEMYDRVLQQRGKLAEVLKVHSLHPASLSSHMQLYMDVMFAQSPLSRAEREMIAVVVSAANGCTYCQQHHGMALLAYWKLPERVDKLKTDFETAGLSPKELALCRFAVHLTHHPASHQHASYLAPLQQAGLTDRAILDVVLVVSYFNFVNRMVLALGVQLEGDQGSGYHY